MREGSLVVKLEAASSGRMEGMRRRLWRLLWGVGSSNKAYFEATMYIPTEYRAQDSTLST